MLLPELRTNEMGKRGEGPTNVAEHIRHDRGDVEQGFARAAVVVERTFHSATVHQGYIEPQNAVASWNNDGASRSGAARRRPFPCANSWPRCCRCRWPINVTPTEIGGGFGGKNASTWNRWRRCYRQAGAGR